MKSLAFHLANADTEVCRYDAIQELSELPPTLLCTAVSAQISTGRMVSLLISFGDLLFAAPYRSSGNFVQPGMNGSQIRSLIDGSDEMFAAMDVLNRCPHCRQPMISVQGLDNRNQPIVEQYCVNHYCGYYDPGLLESLSRLLPDPLQSLWMNRLVVHYTGRSFPYNCTTTDALQLKMQLLSSPARVLLAFLLVPSSLDPFVSEMDARCRNGAELIDRVFSGSGHLGCSDESVLEGLRFVTQSLALNHWLHIPN